MNSCAFHHSFHHSCQSCTDMYVACLLLPRGGKGRMGAIGGVIGLRIWEGGEVGVYMGGGVRQVGVRKGRRMNWWEREKDG